MADKKAETEPREFAAFLIDRPSTHSELSEALRTLTARVRDTGKPGTLTLAVTVKPFDGDVDVLAVSDLIKLKLPEHDRKPGIFYPDRDGNLTRTDPNAMDFSRLVELPDHDARTGEIKEV